MKRLFLYTLALTASVVFLSRAAVQATVGDASRMPASHEATTSTNSTTVAVSNSKASSTNELRSKSESRTSR